jgi:hypothetical protein
MKKHSMGARVGVAILLAAAFAMTCAGTAAAQAEPPLPLDADDTQNPPVGRSPAASPNAASPNAATTAPKTAPDGAENASSGESGLVAPNEPLDADTTLDPPVKGTPVPSTIETLVSKDVEVTPDGTTITTVVTETTREDRTRPLVGYKGGFFLQAPEGPNLLRIGGQLQTLYTYQRVNDQFTRSRFQLRRARLKMKGTLFTRDLTFGLSLEMGDGDVRLKDYWTNYVFKEDAELKVGQFKRPYDRQEITSSTRLLMVTRAITNDEFGAGRDIGIMLHNHEEEELAYALGFFNGTGTGARLDDDLRFTNVPAKFRPQAVFRVGYNSKGVNGYDENDLKGGPPRLAAAISGLADFNIDELNEARLSAEADAIVKAYFFSVTGSLFIETEQTLPGPSATSGTNWTDQQLNGFGAYIQAGYVIEHVVQPAARLAVVSLKDGFPDRQTVYEASFGLNVYFFGENLKWLNQGRILFAPNDNRQYSAFSMLAMAF